MSDAVERVVSIVVTNLRDSEFSVNHKLRIEQIRQCQHWSGSWEALNALFVVECCRIAEQTVVVIVQFVSLDRIRCHCSSQITNVFN
ncbi:hypothetical protein D3C75_992500 [compost metagenome]